jgi:regulator of replication initiation timing
MNQNYTIPANARRAKMEETVQELKTIIREMILEIGDLKEKVARLEQTISHEEAAQPVQYSLKFQAESYENIGKIYKQGYHVCPIAFGEPRNEECLFCIAFIEKE